MDFQLAHLVVDGIDDCSETLPGIRDLGAEAVNKGGPDETVEVAKRAPLVVIVVSPVAVNY